MTTLLAFVGQPFRASGNLTGGLFLITGCVLGLLSWTGCVTEDGFFDTQDMDGDGYAPQEGDCNDHNVDIHPGAQELCDGLDNNCDDEIDNRDLDRDGYIDFYCSGEDCNDNASSINPAANETCNTVDDDCDGLIDEADRDVHGQSAFYLDLDSDGYGVGEYTVMRCEAEWPYQATVSGDCDDTSPAVNPDATEVCNQYDDDCDGEVDEDLTSIFYIDNDEDGYGDSERDTEACIAPFGYVTEGGDCDDTRSEINPGMDEVCNDGFDNNCDNAGCEWSETLSLAEDAIRLSGENSGDYAGFSLASAGDTNGDGYDDILIGASGEDNGDSGSAAGAAYLVLGPVDGSMSLSNADVKLIGVAEGDQVGSSVASAGDFNGDGNDDIAIGAPGADGGGEDSGAVYIFFGPVIDSYDLNDANVILYGTAGDAIGSALTNAGDLDGDGYGDFLIGAPGEDTGGANAGAVYLVEGPLENSAELEQVFSAKLIGESAGDEAGSAIALLGDHNSDGQTDIAIGARSEDTGGNDAGAAYVVNGPISGLIDLSRANAKMVGESGGDLAASTLASAGDMDGDGYSDILVGARNWYGNDETYGATYVNYGPVGSSELADSDVKLVGEKSGDHAGYGLTGLGDINRDGYDDVAIGAPGQSSSEDNPGKVYIFFGPLETVSSISEADIIVSGGSPGDLVGATLASAGDVNGDGYDDILIGAYNASSADSGAGAGAVYIVEGRGL